MKIASLISKSDKQQQVDQITEHGFQDRIPMRVLLNLGEDDMLQWTGSDFELSRPNFTEQKQLQWNLRYDAASQPK